MPLPTTIPTIINRLKIPIPPRNVSNKNKIICKGSGRMQKIINATIYTPIAILSPSLIFFHYTPDNSISQLLILSVRSSFLNLTA